MKGNKFILVTSLQLIFLIYVIMVITNQYHGLSIFGTLDYAFLTFFSVPIGIILIFLKPNQVFNII